MDSSNVETQIQDIMTNKKNSVSEQREQLEKMRQEVRAEIRAASESAMVDDQDIGEELRKIDLAIDSIDPDAEDDRNDGPATL